MDLFLEPQLFLYDEHFLDDVNDRRVAFAPHRKEIVHIAIDHDAADLDSFLCERKVDSLTPFVNFLAHANAALRNRTLLDDHLLFDHRNNGLLFGFLFG